MERVRKRYSLALKQKIMEEIRDGKWTSAWQASKMWLFGHKCGSSQAA